MTLTPKTWWQSLNLWSAASTYLDRRLIVIFLMGYASGLPLLLSGATLSIWLTEAGVTLTAIGLFALVGTPYNVKFLWAPIIDRVPVFLLSGWLGRRRAWMVVIQLALMASIFGLGMSQPETNPYFTAIFALAVAFFSASQDIVIDAYRIEILDEDQQGAGAAMTQAGYRFGLIASGAGALYLAEIADWFIVYAVMAALVLVGFVVALRAPSPPVEPAAEPATKDIKTQFKVAVIEPFAEFFSRNTGRAAFAILAFILLYKFGDAFAGVMANPFYIKIGFTKIEIANVSKIFGVIATLAGVFIGGALVKSFGILPSLLGFGVLQMLSNLMFAAQAAIGPKVEFLYLTIGLENLSGGMGSSAFVAYLSVLCNIRYTGTQFALFTSFMAFGRTWLSAMSGWLADQTDWVTFFIVSTLVAIPGLIVLCWMMKNLPIDVQTGRDPKEPDVQEPPVGKIGGTDARPRTRPEYLSWSYVIAWSGLIFVSVPFVRSAVDYVRQHWDAGIFTYVVAAIVVLVSAAAITLLLKRRQLTVLGCAWLLAVAGIVLYLIFDLKAGSPVEAIHFLQYGVLSLLLFRAFAHRVRDYSIYIAVTIAGSAIGIIDETIQWLTPGRIFGVEDIWLNFTAVALVQTALAAGVRPHAISGWPDGAGLRRLCHLCAVAVGLLGLCFLNTPDRIASLSARMPLPDFVANNQGVMIEYGYLHGDVVNGMFYSRFSIEDLRRLDRARAVEGALILDRYRDRRRYAEFLETYTPMNDPFLHEARLHLYSRNVNLEWARDATDTKLQRHRFTSAYWENRILEENFSELLRASKMRWSPVLAAEIRSKIDTGRIFKSLVSRHLITAFTRKQAFWAFLCAVVSLLLLGRFFRKQSPS